MNSHEQAVAQELDELPLRPLSADAARAASDPHHRHPARRRVAGLGLSRLCLLLLSAVLLGRQALRGLDARHYEDRRLSSAWKASCSGSSPASPSTRSGARCSSACGTTS